MPTVEPEIVYLSDVLLPRDPQKANHAATKNYVDTQVTTLAPIVHSHVVADVTGLGTAATVNTGLLEGNVPVLDVNGKLSNNVLPALAITNTFVVAAQAAMLALSAEEGDIAIRTDLNKSFILAGDDPTSLVNWQELLTPTDAVSSVNGQTGAVSITIADLGAAAANHDHSELYLPNTILGMPGGVAELNSFGQIPLEDLPTESVLTNSSALIPTSAAVFTVISNHTSATNAHSATATPTANRIAMYNASGLLSSGTPTASAHVATKGYVDDLATSNRYRTTLSGDGISTEFEVTHNLNSSEVEVQVYHAVVIETVNNYANYVISGSVEMDNTSTAKATVTLPSGTVVEVNLDYTNQDDGNGTYWREWSGTANNVVDSTYDTVTFSCRTDGVFSPPFGPNDSPHDIACTLSNSNSPKTTPVLVAYSPTTANKITLSFATAPGTAASGHSFIVVVRK
jgi:hypothetical protein